MNINIRQPEASQQTKPKISRKWWTGKQVASHYNVSVRAIANWVREGRIAKPVKAPNGRDNLWSDETIRELDSALNGEEA